MAGPRKHPLRALTCAGALVVGGGLSQLGDLARPASARDAVASATAPRRPASSPSRAAPSSPTAPPEAEQPPPRPTPAPPATRAARGPLVRFPEGVDDGGADDPATEERHEREQTGDRWGSDAPAALGARFRRGLAVTGATPHRLLLLSFDDGPDLARTPRLLDTLDEHGIKALFFLTAERIDPRNPWGEAHAELAREIARRGHIIGNHTVDHAQLPLLDDAEVEAQLDESQRIFERVLGGRPWLFRPPGGARSPRTDALVERRGYTQVLWNLGTGDFQVRSPEAVVETWTNVLARRHEENGDRGGIILLHDIHEWSVDAVPLLLSHIRQTNCQLLERGEELYDLVDDPALFFVPKGAAPPGAIAPPALPDPEILSRRQERLRQETRARCGS